MLKEIFVDQKKSVLSRVGVSTRHYGESHRQGGMEVGSRGGGIGWEGQEERLGALASKFQ